MKTIGIKLADGSFFPVLEEDNPTEKYLELTTAHNNQTKVMVDLYRSESCSMDDAEYVDSLQIENLVAHPNGEPNISFCVSLDDNKQLAAKIKDPETGNQSNTAITLVSRTLEERLTTDEYDITDSNEEISDARGQADEPATETENSGAGAAAVVATAAAGVGLLSMADKLIAKEQEEPEETLVEETPIEEPSVEEDPMFEETFAEAPIESAEDSSTAIDNSIDDATLEDFSMDDLNMDNLPSEDFSVNDIPGDDTVIDSVAEDFNMDDLTMDNIPEEIEVPTDTDNLGLTSEAEESFEDSDDNMFNIPIDTQEPDTISDETFDLPQETNELEETVEPEESDFDMPDMEIPLNIEDTEESESFEIPTDSEETNEIENSEDTIISDDTVNFEDSIPEDSETPDFNFDIPEDAENNKSIDDIASDEKFFADEKDVISGVDSEDLSLPDFNDDEKDNLDIEDPQLPDDFFNTDELNETADNLNIDSNDNDFDDDFFDESLSKDNTQPIASSDGLSFTGLYDKETEMGVSGVQEEEIKKKTKVPVIICIICAVICLIATLLILFIIPSKYNLINKTKTETTVIATEKTEKKEAEKIEEQVPEAPVVQEKEPEPVVPEAKEDEIVIVEKAEEVVPEQPEVIEEKLENISYKIKWGDTLWDISDTYYKNPWRYKYIARYNGISNPDHIISGTKIIIPAE